MAKIVTVRTRTGTIAVVEVLGLPGSGKTTVAEAIAASGAVEVMSRYRSSANAPAYVMAAMKLFPVLAPSLWQGRSWRERNKLVRLESSGSIARRHARRGKNVLVFDQGPVFLLKQLSQHEGVRPDAIEVHRQKLLRWWGRTLDLALVLDAPDEVLLRRVRRRTKRHALLSGTEDEGHQAFATERRAFERVFEELSGEGGVRVRRIDTSASSVIDTSEAVLRCIQHVAPV